MTETSKPASHAFSRKMFVRYLTHIEQELTHHLELSDARGIAVPRDFVVACRPGFSIPAVLKPDSMRNINAFMSAWRFFTPTAVPDRYKDLYFGCTLNDWDGIYWKSITGVTVMITDKPVCLTEAKGCRGERWTIPPGKRDTACYADKRAALGQSAPSGGWFTRKPDAPVQRSMSDCKWGDKCFKHQKGDCRFAHPGDSQAPSNPPPSKPYDNTPMCKWGADKCHKHQKGACRLRH